MAKQSRREFLENSMFAAAAAAAGVGTLTNRVAAQTSTSPNERLRVAILGVNGRGRTHIDNFARRADCDIAAIVDPDDTIGNKKGVAIVEEKTGMKPAFYQDLRQVMDDSSIDIVAIATPNHWHSLATIWALQAGKDVFVEKPVSHNVSEGRRCVEAARKYNKICQAGTQSRSHQAHVEAIQWLHDGGIGQVKLARGLCYKPRPSIGATGNYDVPRGVDYNLWLGPAPIKAVSRPQFHYDWHWFWDYGNADMGNQGIHQMDIARWGLGVDHIGDSVFSYGGRLGYEDAGETANSQVNIHTFGDKQIVFETRGLETDAYRDVKIGVIFYGSEGYLLSTSKYDYVSAFDLDGKMVKEFKGGTVSDHFDNFVEAVRSRKAEDLNGDILEGHLSSALCHLGNISYVMGELMPTEEILKKLPHDQHARDTFDRMVEHLGENEVQLEKTPLRCGPLLDIDGQREVFSGELADAANLHLTRKYREPFVVPETRNL